MSIFSDSLSEREFKSLGAEMNRRDRIERERMYEPEFECEICNKRSSHLYFWFCSEDDEKEICSNCMINLPELKYKEDSECQECGFKGDLFFDPNSLKWVCEGCLENSHEIPIKDLIEERCD
jgi:replicative superfamily II helicase